MIRFTVKANWKEEEVASRVAEVIGPTPSCPPIKNPGAGYWQLNGSNDWWLEKVEDTKDLHGATYELRSRYGSPELLEALRVVLEWTFD